MEIYNLLRRVCLTKQNVNLKAMCSIKIGGIAKFVCYPSRIKQLKKLLKILDQIGLKHFIVGKGTNIVFEDGYRNFVFVSTDKLKTIKIKKNVVSALCGAGLFALNNKLQSLGLGGLEWSYGIPGSIGGAIIMNAGAFGHEIGEFVKSVLVIDGGKYKVLTNKNLKFAYRSTVLKNSKLVVVKVNLILSYRNQQKIKEAQQNYYNKRKELQPYDKPSCGSVFLKTIDGSAGKTIDKLGLKGVKLGGMQISIKNANFFINLGNATSKDMHKLIKKVKALAKQNGINLLEEVIFI